MSENLSPAHEDYLESILILQNKNDEVRVKDLADCLKVSAPSVNEALCNLKDKGFVNHERYGTITLSEQGKIIASKVYKRHQIISNFLSKVLGVDAKIAEQDACKIEHYLSKETVNKIIVFSKEGETIVEPVKLSSLKPKEKCKILEIDVKGELKKRMLEMGILKGGIIEMVRVAPLGDPMDIKVKGYNLSLRKIEAEKIWVERI